MSIKSPPPPGSALSKPSYKPAGIVGGPGSVVPVSKSSAKPVAEKSVDPVAASQAPFSGVKSTPSKTGA